MDGDENTTPALDSWVCRIPRPVLHNMAANKSLRHRERVLMAMVAELFSTRDNGEGPTSLARLVRITGIDRRSVQRAQRQLEVDGVVEATEAKPGQMRQFRLTGYATFAHGTESAHPSDQKRAPQGAQPLRTPPSATLAHPTNEIKKRKNFLEQGAAAKAAENGRTAAEQAELDLVHERRRREDAAVADAIKRQRRRNEELPL